MTYALIKSIFKQIRTLAHVDAFLAEATKANVRHHFELYHINAKNRKIIPRLKQKDDELPKSFLQFLEAVNSNDQQFSQKAKMKLVELVFNINKFANSRFEIRREQQSAQMNRLQLSQEFKNLQSQKQKDFVRAIIKKILVGEEIYPYRTQAEFFNDHRSQSCLIRKKQHITIMDQAAKEYIEGILSGEIKANIYFKRIYQHYFTDVSHEELAFQSYLNSNFVMMDFDDTQQGWNTNSKQVQKSKEAKRKKDQEGQEKKKEKLKEKEAIQKQITEQLLKEGRRPITQPNRNRRKTQGQAPRSFSPKK